MNRLVAAGLFAALPFTATGKVPGQPPDPGRPLLSSPFFCPSSRKSYLRNAGHLIFSIASATRAPSARTFFGMAALILTMGTAPSRPSASSALAAASDS